MSSNIRVQRICMLCNKEFVAKTTVTKYCGDTCAKRAYKLRVRDKKIKESNKETQTILNKPLEDLKAKEFLSVQDVSLLLGCSTRTTYRLIKDGKIKAVNLGERITRVKRSDLNNLWN